jgi:hypothetical protein
MLKKTDIFDSFLRKELFAISLSRRDVYRGVAAAGFGNYRRGAGDFLRIL